MMAETVASNSTHVSASSISQGGSGSYRGSQYHCPHQQGDTGSYRVTVSRPTSAVVLTVTGVTVSLPTSAVVLTVTGVTVSRPTSAVVLAVTGGRRFWRTKQQSLGTPEVPRHETSSPPASRQQHQQQKQQQKVVTWSQT